MRGSLPIICSGQARRTDGPSSPTVPNQGAYGPARPTLGGWPSPERQLEIFADSRQSEHARGGASSLAAADALPAPHPNLLPASGGKGSPCLARAGRPRTGELRGRPPMLDVAP